MAAPLASFRLLDRAVRFLVKGRFAILLLWIIGLTICALQLPKLRFEFSLQPLLEGDAAEVEAVRQHMRTFPPAEGHAIISASWDSTITIDQLREAGNWVKRLEKLPEVQRVYSATSILDLRIQGFTLDEWAELGGDGSEPISMGNSPGMGTIRGRFISRDLESLAFHVQKSRGTSYSRLLDALDKETATWNQPVRILGTNLLLRDMGNILKSNLVQLLVLEIIALVIILPLLLRSLLKAYLPLSVAITGLMVYFGVMVAADQPIGLIYLAGPILLLVIGLSDAIHLQQHYCDARSEGLDTIEALKKTLRNVGSACVLTSLTTAIGFLSLIFATHPEVREFGMWCAIGVSIAFFVVVSFLPVALACFPMPVNRPDPLRQVLNPARINRLAVPAALLLTVVSVGAAFVKIDSSVTQELPPTTPSVKNLDWFAKHFHGTDRVEIAVNGPLENPEVFAAVETLQAELTSLDGIVSSNSYVDAIRFALPTKIVDTDEGPYLGLQTLGSLDSFPRDLLTRSGDQATIIFYTTEDFGSHHFQAFAERFHKLHRDLPAQAKFELAGYIAMAYGSINSITNTLLQSFAISLFAITIVMAISLRSPGLALLCVIPNALPIVVAVGLAGWFGVPLRLGVILVFSVGLGLAVDDTIHYMVRFRQLRRQDPTASLKEHLNEALRSSGFAILLTSLVLFIAAAAFLKSDFATMRDTGIMLAIITTAAFLADICILPWLLRIYYRVFPQPGTVSPS